MNETHAIMLAFTPTEPNSGAIMPPAHGMRASHFPASVSVDEGNGSAAYLRQAHRAKGCGDTKKANKIRFDFVRFWWRLADLNR